MNPATDEEIAALKDMEHVVVQSLISRIQIEIAARKELENDVVFWQGQAAKRRSQMGHIEALTQRIIVELQL